MLWEYMDLTVLPFFETWSAHIFGGWQRVCWCTNEAFNQASPTKEFWENCPQKKGGHIYGKNEGWTYLRKLLYKQIKIKTKIKLHLEQEISPSSCGEVCPKPRTFLQTSSSDFLKHLRFFQNIWLIWRNAPIDMMHCDTTDARPIMPISWDSVSYTHLTLPTTPYV